MQLVMTKAERMTLKSAIKDLSDAEGDWRKGWEVLCRLANINLIDYPPRFRERTAQEFMKRAHRNYPD
jgi:hypothetical protein